jgi:hypothetical protein
VVDEGCGWGQVSWMVWLRRWEDVEGRRCCPFVVCCRGNQLTNGSTFGFQAQI